MALIRLNPDFNFISKDRYFIGEELEGTKNLINHNFDSPEDFLLDFDGGFFLKVERNGQAQCLGKQYTILSSGGVGVGIRFLKPPRINDKLTIDFIKA